MVSTHLKKYARQNGNPPQNKGENFKKYLKPPTSSPKSIFPWFQSISVSRIHGLTHFQGKTANFLSTRKRADLFSSRIQWLLWTFTKIFWNMTILERNRKAMEVELITPLKTNMTLENHHFQWEIHLHFHGPLSSQSDWGYYLGSSHPSEDPSLCIWGVSLCQKSISQWVELKKMHDLPKKVGKKIKHQGKTPIKSQGKQSLKRHDPFILMSDTVIGYVN